MARNFPGQASRRARELGWRLRISFCRADPARLSCAKSFSMTQIADGVQCVRQKCGQFVGNSLPGSTRHGGGTTTDTIVNITERPATA